MRLNSFLKLFLPKDDTFISLFKNAASNLLEATDLLNTLIVTEDTAKRDLLIQKIKDFERKGDEYTHSIFDELNKNFITPFDREDIQLLTSSIDDVLDNINSACYKIRLYKPKRLTSEFEKMCAYLHECAKEIHRAVFELKNINNSKIILEACININTLENLADELYHNFQTYLFETETDAIELIKLKEIIQNFEKAVDCAENVSDVIKSILIKNQ